MMTHSLRPLLWLRSQLWNLMGPHGRVRRAVSEEEREAIYRFRYQVYVEELGKDVPEADHARKWIRDAADDEGTILYYIGTVQAMIGSVRLQIWPADRIPEDFRNKYSLDRLPRNSSPVGETARLIVSTTHRGGLLVAGLATTAYQDLCAAGGHICFGCCAPGLVRAYRRLGYRPYRGRLISVHDGIRIPMLVLTSDLDYLTAVGSPLAFYVTRFFGRHGHPPLDLTPWKSLLDEAATSVVGGENIWRLVRGVLGDEACPLFDKLPTPAVRRIVEKGLIVEVDALQTITRETLVEREIYVILEGRFDVVERERCLTTLERGDVFGEIAFLSESGRRTASVRSCTTGRLLVLRRNFVEELGSQDRHIALQLLRNLGRIVAARLSPRTDNGGT